MVCSFPAGYGDGTDKLTNKKVHSFRFCKSAKRRLSASELDFSPLANVYAMA